MKYGFQSIDLYSYQQTAFTCSLKDKNNHFWHIGWTFDRYHNSFSDLIRFQKYPFYFIPLNINLSAYSYFIHISIIKQMQNHEIFYLQRKKLLPMNMFKQRHYKIIRYDIAFNTFCDLSFHPRCVSGGSQCRWNLEQQC